MQDTLFTFKTNIHEKKSAIATTKKHAITFNF